MINVVLRVGLLSVILSFSLSAQTLSNSHYFFAEIANDVFFLPIKTDRYFTSGMQFEWGVTAKGNTSLLHHKQGVSAKYWRINQDLFTPKAIDSIRVMPNDRPFASYLVISRGNTFSLPLVGFQLRRQWTAGVLGKHSQGGRMQNAFHGMIDFAEEIPGWVNEVKPDLILNYELEVSKRYPIGKRTTAIINVSARLGSLYTDFRPELVFSIIPLRFSDRGKVGLSVSGANRLVGYNATLTGGLFNPDDRYRNSIRPHRSVRDVSALGTLHYAGLELSGGVRWLSPEFKGGLNHVWAWFGVKMN